MKQAQITALDALIEAVERGEDWISVQAAAAFDDKANSVMACRAYGDQGNPKRHGSLDAARELHDNLLPGFEYRLSASNAKVYPYSDTEDVAGKYGMADNPARAWLLAILRAYRAQIGGDA